MNNGFLCHIGFLKDFHMYIIVFENIPSNILIDNYIQLVNLHYAHLFIDSLLCTINKPCELANSIK